MPEFLTGIFDVILRSDSKLHNNWKKFQKNLYYRKYNNESNDKNNQYYNDNNEDNEIIKCNSKSY